MSRHRWATVGLTAFAVTLLMLGGIALAGKPPKDPKNLDYSVITETSIELTWESGGGEDGFIVGYLEDVLPDLKCTNGIVEDADTATSYVVTDLTPGATYGFRVCAYNSTKTTDGATLLVTLSGGTTISYSMTLIPTLGGTRSSTLGMNDHGDVVGFSIREGETSDYAFLYSGGVVTDVSKRPDVIDSGWRLLYASDINDKGQIVGGGFYNEVPTYRAYGLTLGDGQTTSDIVEDLGFLPGGTYAEPGAINNLGQVVGAADSSTGQHGFFWTEGADMVEINDDTYSTNRAHGLNEAGQVTGVMYIDVQPHAFRYTPGSGIEDLGAIKKPTGGSLWSRGKDINNLGEVVGYCSAGRNTRVFLYTDRISDVGVLEGDDRAEEGANNDWGDIVGVSSPSVGSLSS